MQNSFILPYEPEYSEHWEANRRRKEVREWLRLRESELVQEASPPLAPDHVSERGPVSRADASLS